VVVVVEVLVVSRVEERCVESRANTVEEYLILHQPSMRGGEIGTLVRRENDENRGSKGKL